MPESEPVDINIRNVPPELRQRFKAAAHGEGRTYSDMIRDIVRFYENDTETFRRGIERAKRGRRRRRSRE